MYTHIDALGFTEYDSGHGSDSHDTVITDITNASMKTGIRLTSDQISRIRPISDIYAANSNNTSEIVLLTYIAYIGSRSDAYTQYLDTNRELIGHTFFIGDFSPNVCEDGVLQELEQTMMTRSHRRFWNWESRNRISFGQEQNSVYYKHDHDAPERPYHPERVQSHVSFS
jgi:hypothetical protein